jgi:5-methylcytosine-specific restriction protein A
MENILREPLINYLGEKKKKLAGNSLAGKLRTEFPEILRELLLDKIRYKVIGSAGKGNWADCPWIAILDTLITESPEAGYYLVFLFKADMSGVYLSINQGVTEVKEYYKKKAVDVLKLRAEDFRAKLNTNSNFSCKIELQSRRLYAKLYEAGNVLAKYYSIDNLPNTEILKGDVLSFLKIYEELTFNDTQLNEKNGLSAIEKKQCRLHFRIERNLSISRKVKTKKGYTCEACGLDFKKKYGELGKEFIEAHHLIPVSSLNIGYSLVNIETDFAVLCSNCHSMIHRLNDSSDLNKLREIIHTNKSN